MHGQEGIDMIGMLLQKCHYGVRIKAGLTLLKQHLNGLHVIEPLVMFTQYGLMLFLTAATQTGC